MKQFSLLFFKIEQLTKDWTSKWTDRKAIMEEYSVDINKEKAGVTIDSNLPHLMAMDDDILSTGVVLYHLRVRDMVTCLILPFNLEIFVFFGNGG